MRFFRNMVTVYQTTQCHVPEDKPSNPMFLNQYTLFCCVFLEVQITLCKVGIINHVQCILNATCDSYLLEFCITKLVKVFLYIKYYDHTPQIITHFLYLIRFLFLYVRVPLIIQQMTAQKYPNFVIWSLLLSAGSLLSIKMSNNMNDINKHLVIIFHYSARSESVLSLMSTSDIPT